MILHPVPLMVICLILIGIPIIPCPAWGNPPVASDQGELLYNGIRLPAEWPPRLERLEPKPRRVPYLIQPPKVIPINVGRQLFIDDFLIQSTTLARTFRRPVYYEGNPILVPEESWEMTGRGPMAIPHSGGVCYDPADQLSKMWYIAGYQQGVGLVYSKNGINWRRPAFDHVLPGSNLVYDEGSRGSTIWHDLETDDPPREDLQVSPQLYDLDVVAYESILLGTFIIWRGDYRRNANTDEAKAQNLLGRPKQNSACIGFSRDGFHWHRPDRCVFLPKSNKPGDWNWGNSQTAAKSPLVVGDRLYFYVAGRAGLTFPGNTYQDAGGSTGLAFLRRDGFASMDAGRNAGILITRPVRFSGKYLFVNVNNPAGRLRVAISEESGKSIAPFSFDNCTPLTTDSTRHAVQWKGVDDLSQLVGKSVKFSFELSDGELYAFWVSPDRSGASYGYVAGGGPGFVSNRDTVGNPSNE